MIYLDGIMDSRSLQDTIDEYYTTPTKDRDPEDYQIIQDLVSIREEIGGEWNYGVTLIHDNSFMDYAKELVESLGDLPADLPWYIESNIDWTGVAKDVQQDYASSTIDGECYWYPY